MRFGGIALLLLAASARGDVVTYEFSGTVQRTVNADEVFGIPVAVGDVFSGTVSYDTAVIDSDPSPKLGSYKQTVGFSLDLHGRTLSSDVSEVRIYDDFELFGADALDMFDIASILLSRDGSPVVGSFLLRLVDLTATAFTGDALPVIDFADFAAPYNFTQGEIRDLGSPMPTIFSFSIDQFRPVPEPTSLALLGCGLAGLLAIRRR